MSDPLSFLSVDFLYRPSSSATSLLLETMLPKKLLTLRLEGKNLKVQKYSTQCMGTGAILT